MQELRLVAVSEDGTYLVLATAGRGTRFTLPVDDRLRAAVRGHFSRLGQFEIEVESTLRPKEIQARIRAGETAEEIAESAGIPVERVRWFEGPVLQEREYMAQQAQRAAVRRPGESTPGPPLGEMVEERLGRGGVDLEEVEWDSWKCEDGTWRVRVSFFDEGRPHAAEWLFDPRRRNISPLDEVAARLTSTEWHRPAADDTVTPLVPRRPAMKVVSDYRDIGVERRPAAEPRPPAQSLDRAVEEALATAAAPAITPVPAPRDRVPAEPADAAEQPEQDSAVTSTEQAAEQRPEPAQAPSTRAEQVLSVAPSAEQTQDVQVQDAQVHEEQTPGERSEQNEKDDKDEKDERERHEKDERAGDHESAGLRTAPPQPASAEPASPEEAEPDQTEQAEPTARAEPEPAEPTAQAEPKPVEPVPAPRRAAEPAPPGEAASTSADPATPTEPVKPAEPESGRQPGRTNRTEPRRPRAKPASRPAAEQTESGGTATGAGKQPRADEPAAGSDAPARQAARAGARRKSKGKRASVPSWDEIMFGARRPD